MNGDDHLAKLEIRQLNVHFHNIQLDGGMGCNGICLCLLHLLGVTLPLVCA